MTTVSGPRRDAQPAGHDYRLDPFPKECQWNEMPELVLRNIFHQVRELEANERTHTRLSEVCRIFQKISDSIDANKKSIQSKQFLGNFKKVFGRSNLVQFQSYIRRHLTPDREYVYFQPNPGPMYQIKDLNPREKNKIFPYFVRDFLKFIYRSQGIRLKKLPLENSIFYIEEFVKIFLEQLEKKCPDLVAKIMVENVYGRLCFKRINLEELTFEDYQNIMKSFFGQLELDLVERSKSCLRIVTLISLLAMGIFFGGYFLLFRNSSLFYGSVGLLMMLLSLCPLGFVFANDFDDLDEFVVRPIQILYHHQTSKFMDFSIS